MRSISIVRGGCAPGSPDVAVDGKGALGGGLAVDGAPLVLLVDGAPGGVGDVAAGGAANVGCLGGVLSCDGLLAGLARYDWDGEEDFCAEISEC